MSPNTDKITTIRVRESTKKRLQNLGKMNESMDQLINRILDAIEKNKEVLKKNT